MTKQKTLHASFHKNLHVLQLIHFLLDSKSAALTMRGEAAGERIQVAC
jgi:hypothetical protein